MSKEKHNVHPVGATNGRPYFEEFAKKQNAITLVALIITIIVMLILVGVSVTAAINGGLFNKTKEASNRMEDEMKKELALLEGPFEIDGKKYASYEDYLNNKEMKELPKGWKVTETLAEWTKADGTINNKVTAITDGTNTVPLPEGYWVSLEEGESSISEGMVITDGENEFVWIPVETDFKLSYNTTIYRDNYLEPKILGKDSQTNLNSYYEENYYAILDTDEYQNNVNNKFAYKVHYAEMVESVNKYKGFYIGRYETTIDENKIGSKEGAIILSADQSIAQTNNKQVRWWGLYDVQRNSDVKGNGNIVQTNMVWGQQWDAMITLFDNESKDYTSTEVTTVSTSGKQNAGQAKYTYNSKTISDEICNIYDLRGNVRDWTAEAWNNDRRVLRARFCRFSFHRLSVRRLRLRWFSPYTLYKITL